MPIANNSRLVAPGALLAVLLLIGFALAQARYAVARISTILARVRASGADSNEASSLAPLDAGFCPIPVKVVSDGPRQSFVEGYEVR